MVLKPNMYLLPQRHSQVIFLFYLLSAKHYHKLYSLCIVKITQILKFYLKRLNLLMSRMNGGTATTATVITF